MKTAPITDSRVALADEPLDLRLEGPPPETVRWEAQFQDDLGQTWASETHGSPSRLLWSMQMTRAGYGPPVPYAEATTASLRPLDVQVRAKAGGVHAEVRLERHFLGPGAERREWREDELVADLFLPAGEGPHRATLVLAGSGGGFGWSSQVAALLASRGRAALALAYFDWQGEHDLPTSISEIPVEQSQRALERLAEEPALTTDDLAVVGYSKGSELALLLAAEEELVRRVVAVAPSAYVWEDARMDPNAPRRSSWSRGGEPLAFLALDLDAEFYETFDKSRLRPFHDRALADEEALGRARLPVENICGPILLLAGSEDGVWPSCAMAETIVQSMERAGKGDLVERRCYQGAGHFLNPPGLPVTPDGDVAATARASEQAWQAMLRHLDVSQSRSSPEA